MSPRPDWHLSYTTEVIANVVFIVAALGALVYTLHLARSTGKRWPLAMFAAGGAAIAYEVIADHIGGATYPEQGVTPIFTLWDRQLPLYVFFIYFTYFGWVAIWLMHHLDTGRAQRHWWRWYGYHVAGVFAFEPLIIHVGLWKYWGANQPVGLFDFPAWWWFANSAMLFNATALMYLVRRYLISDRDSWMLVLLYPMAIMGVHGSCSIPVGLAINSTSNRLIVNIAALATIGLSLMITALVGRAVTRTAASPVREEPARELALAAA